MYLACYLHLGFRMKKIKLKDIEVTQEDKIAVMKIWEANQIITRNLDNIISDFDFINQNTEYQIADDTPEILQGIKNDKMKWINAHICGVVCTLSPESQFNKNHITASGKTAVEIEEENKKNDFAKSLQP